MHFNSEHPESDNAKKINKLKKERGNLLFPYSEMGVGMRRTSFSVIPDAERAYDRT